MSTRTRLTLLSTAAAGAALYFFDTTHGQSRRKTFKANAQRFYEKTRQALEKLPDMACKATEKISKNLKATDVAESEQPEQVQPSSEVSDQLLVQKIKSRLGREVPEFHSIHVDAQSGTVRLSGVLPENKSEEIVSLVRSVEGVQNVQVDFNRGMGQSQATST